jgi:hypothetical protein
MRLFKIDGLYTGRALTPAGIFAVIGWLHGGWFIRWLMCRRLRKAFAGSANVYVCCGSVVVDILEA